LWFVFDLVFRHPAPPSDRLSSTIPTRWRIHFVFLSGIIFFSFDALTASFFFVIAACRVLFSCLGPGFLPVKDFYTCFFFFSPLFAEYP